MLFSLRERFDLLRFNGIVVAIRLRIDFDRFQFPFR